MQGKALNEIQIRQIAKSVAKGNSVNYICCSLGVGRSAVYRQINMTPDEYREYCARRKPKKQQSKPEKRQPGYRKKLPPEQWIGARVFLMIVTTLKREKMRVKQIDLDEIKEVWQQKMNEVEGAVM